LSEERVLICDGCFHCVTHCICGPNDTPSPCDIKFSPPLLPCKVCQHIQEGFMNIGNVDFITPSKLQEMNARDLRGLTRPLAVLDESPLTRTNGVTHHRPLVIVFPYEQYLEMQNQLLKALEAVKEHERAFLKAMFPGV